MPIFLKEFGVETNASSNSLGVVLMQDKRPIAFLSKALSPQNQEKLVYEHKLTAIVMAFQKWQQHYLLGRHIKVHTDQMNLKFLIDQ